MKNCHVFFSNAEIAYVKSIPDDFLKALSIIGRVYAERLDKSGNAEAGHFIRVSNQGENDDVKIVGLLHDVVEDRHITLNDLIYLGFKENIITAISLLNNDKTIYPNYHSYITNIIESGNLLAIKVKYYDMKDNLSPDRLERLPKEKREKALHKYTPELPRLEMALNELNREKKRVIKL